MIPFDFFADQARAIAQFVLQFGMDFTDRKNPYSLAWHHVASGDMRRRKTRSGKTCKTVRFQRKR